MRILRKILSQSRYQVLQLRRISFKFGLRTMSSGPKQTPYGSWLSPLTADKVTQKAKHLEELRIDPAHEQGKEGKVYWSELRPADGGCYRICSWSPSHPQPVQWTKGDYNARTRIHEYGGGSFFVFAGVVYFSNFSDQAMYKQTSPDADPVRLTPLSKGWRYADGSYVESKRRVFCVREDHGPSGNANPIDVKNTIVSFAVGGEEEAQSVLVEGCDFYSSPRVSPDGSHLCWMQWNHPDMPWDSTEVWCAKLNDDGSALLPESRHKVSGGEGISVMTPEWSPSGVLHYISDESNWWHLFSQSGEPVGEKTAAEIGFPHWQFGHVPYAFNPVNGKEIAVTYKSDLSVHNAETNSSSNLATGYPLNKNPRFCPDGHIFVIASSPEKFPAILRVNAKTEIVQVVYISRELDIDVGYISSPQKITYATGAELEGTEEAHAYFYSPKNKDFVAPEGELPPLLVRAHGGPTGCTSPALNLSHQYWTSRGFAVLDVDYRGSTGYGRTYRDRLKLNWGILDAEDCFHAANYLAKKQLVDCNRMTIDGGSAGGLTTLNALALPDPMNVFHAGCSRYGVSDLLSLQLETHKFESRYCDQLIAPWPEGIQTYKDRSPVNKVDKLRCPAIFFQGDEDKIVLPNQSEVMFDALKKKGIATSYVLFKGEQHGFRKRENIIECLEGELYFFGKVLGFKPADNIEKPPKIFNLD
eukprot:m.3112 g.3112  ORF g.3112 m.3112 type:complete len:698 (+) comp9060_c0_seq1:24-2117(+)